MDRDIAEALERVFGERPSSSRPVGGGCISEAALVDFPGGRRVFLKVNRSGPPDLFECEAAGLRALARPGILRVPNVLAVGGPSNGAPTFIALEAIAEGARARGFHSTFGRDLARLHRATRHHRCGFDHDNHIGASPQPNPWTDAWPEFFREHRIRFQLDLAARNGFGAALARPAARFLAQLPDALGDSASEAPVLLHGDLWGGNYLCDDSGRAVLIDPAAYYGHREMDLAMTQLFGGFPAEFLDAYEGEWALAPGWRERLGVYQVYHLLNHLNLFGGGYLGQCLDAMGRVG